MTLHAVIMAGGSGTRFWPASRQEVPKQLLKIGSPRSMLQTTFDRLSGLVSSQHVLVATNAQLVEAVIAQLPDLPIEHIIGEPVKRDTAPCIGVAASLVQAADKDGMMIVMPSLRIFITSTCTFVTKGQVASNIFKPRCSAS